MRPVRTKSTFSRLAKWTAHMTGRPLAFIIAVATIAIWATTGPFFHYSDTWQLVINTGTTIITFLMVLSTQNRDAEAVQVKLDELIRAVEGAHNALLDLEELEEEELDRIHARYCRLAASAREHLRQGLKDTDAPEAESDAEIST